MSSSRLLSPVISGCTKMRSAMFSSFSKTSRIVRVAPSAARAMSAEPQKCVTLENMNPHIKTMEYAVRGPLVIRATEIEKELEQVGEFPLRPRFFLHEYNSKDGIKFLLEQC